MRKILLSFVICLVAFSSCTRAQNVTSAPRYNKASYHMPSTGKFLRTWLISGPQKISKDSSSPDVGSQEKFFNESHLQGDSLHFASLHLSAGSVEKMKWTSYTSASDQVNFDSVYRNTDYAIAWAAAEIITDRKMSVLLGVGSDDAVKVFHNGKQVHKNWIARGIMADNDLVPIDLVKGSNQILIEVQDIAGGWGFIARILDKTAIGEQLIKAAGAGDIDQIRLLVKSGGDINQKGKGGITPLQAAKINGRQQAANVLMDEGAKDLPVPTAGTLVESLYADRNQKPVPGIAVLVSQNGKILYENGFGYADLKNRERVTPSTKFRIGSITKQFTASAILLLQQEGKLKVTDPLSTYFPDFPRAREVTIHHLLTHTSGIHSYTNSDSFLEKVVTPVTNEELLNYFKNDPYDFNPGERYQYNNSGYFLLGYIIEKITGETLDQHFKRKFFDPLGMTNTGIYKSNLNLTNEAKGYNKENETYAPALPWDMTWAAGAGALYSTVEDLSKWNDAVFNGKVLSDASLKAALTPVLLNNGSKPPGTDYGYGWGIGNYRGLELITHSGGLHGFISQLAWYPKEKLTVAMLTNQMPIEVELNPNKIAELFLWQKMDTQTSFDVKEVSGVDLKKYEGRFDIQNGIVVAITSEGKSLYAQVSGQAKFEIFPSGPDQYFWKVVEANIRFIRNEKGDVDSAHFEQGGYKVTGPKLKDETIINVDPAVFNEYAGKFQFKPNTVIEITTSQGKLYGQATGEQRFELLPLSKEEYLVRDLNAHILFIRDADGKVNKINVAIGGNKSDAPRIK